MTVHVYAHNSKIDEMNERRAICRMSHILQYSHCGTSTEDDYLFIGNIDPTQDKRIQTMGHLTQLDGLLLGPNFIAIVEFKNYFDPVEAKSLDGKWFARVKKGRALIKGGNKKNPYLQAKHARQTLHKYFLAYDPTLFENSPQTSLNAFYSFVLFHPSLHPKSRLPDLGSDDYWLRFRGVDTIAELALSAGPKDFQLSLEQMKRIAEEAFFAEPWREMVEILKMEWGYMMIQEPGEPTLTRIRLWRYDELTVGRSGQLGHRVQLHNEKISRTHAQIWVDDNGDIRIIDLESKNGTYLEGKLISNKSGQIIPEGEMVTMGGLSPEEATFVWFEKKEYLGETSLTQ